MAGFGDGYVGTGQDAARGFMLSKERDAMFARSEQEKLKMKEETAAYRLGAKDSKFASMSTASEVRPAEACVPRPRGFAA